VAGPALDAFSAQDLARWAEWYRGNVERGVPKAKLREVLEQNGLSEDLVAGHQVAPAAPAGSSPLRYRRFSLESVAALSREDLYHRFYRPNVPVVIEDVSIGEALLWTPESLWGALSDIGVQVIQGEQRVAMRFSDLCRELLDGPRSPLRLSPQSRVLATAAADACWREIQPDARYLRQGPASGAQLHLAGGGARSQLAYDPQVALHCQIYGETRFVLIPPQETERLLPERTLSPIDPWRPDLDLAPLFAEVLRCDITLGPAQALLVPVGYWHATRCEEASIALSFRGFVYPNQAIPS